MMLVSFYVIKTNLRVVNWHLVWVTFCWTIKCTFKHWANQVTATYRWFIIIPARTRNLAHCK